MKNKIIFIFLISQLSGDGNHSSILSINNTRNEMVITIDPQIHIDYGLAYPMTYEFIIPSGSANLQTYRRFKSDQDWSQITEKTTINSSRARKLVEEYLLDNEFWITFFERRYRS